MSVTDEIKAKVDILDLLQTYNVPLKRAGRVWKACCPFHQERTPSFVVYEETGTWRCFGSCAEGGDIFGFVMKQENVDFKGALDILAQRAGIELKPRSSEQRTRDSRLEKLSGLLHETAEFFHLQLRQSDDAAHARAYVHKRGLSHITAEQFRIGYAPGGWQAALTHLQGLGYTEDEAIEAGVATRNDKGNVYDRFRNRVIIPIRDPRGKVTGFGARALSDDDNPKYLNSPQTPLFDKGHTLFAFDAARRAIRETETAVIVEGYMDALQAHQAGFTNVVAQMGTALTEVQLKLLAKYAKKLVIALDPDQAGINATMRGLNVARATLGENAPIFDPGGTLRQSSRLRIDIRVMSLPDDQDPDDLIRDTPDAWTTLVETATPIMDYVIETGAARVTSGMTTPDRERIARELLPILLSGDPDNHYTVQKLALKLRIDDRNLLREWQSMQALNRPLPATQKQQDRIARHIAHAPPAPAALIDAGDSNRAIAPAARMVTTRPDGIDLEGYCLGVMIANPDWLPLVNRAIKQLAPERDALLSPIGPEDFERADYRAVVATWKAAQLDDEPLAYLHENLPTELSDEVNRLLGGPLVALQLKGGWESTEIHGMSAEKRLKKERSPEQEFIEKALLLRQRRIKRESIELGFVVQSSGDDAELLQKMAAVARYRKLTHQIDLMIRELRQRAR